MPLLFGSLLYGFWIVPAHGASFPAVTEASLDLTTLSSSLLYIYNPLHLSPPTQHSFLHIIMPISPQVATFPEFMAYASLHKDSLTADSLSHDMAIYLRVLPTANCTTTVEDARTSTYLAYYLSVPPTYSAMTNVIKSYLYATLPGRLAAWQKRRR